VLTDADKRRTYDNFGEAGMKNNGQGGPGGPGGFHFQQGDPFNVFQNVFGGGQRVHFQFNGGFPGGQHGGAHHGGGGFRQNTGESFYKDDALIQELDDDTLPDGDGEGWIWLVEFYAPWW